MPEQQSNRRRDDKLALILQRQSLAISQLTKEVHLLKTVPQQLSMLEYQMKHMTNMTDDVDKLNTISTRHKTILGLMGAAIVILFPLVVTWNNQLRVEIAELQRTTIMLKERQDRYNGKSSGITITPYSEHGTWNVGETIRL